MALHFRQITQTQATVRCLICVKIKKRENKRRKDDIYVKMCSTKMEHGKLRHLLYPLSAAVFCTAILVILLCRVLFSFFIVYFFCQLLCICMRSGSRSLFYVCTKWSCALAMGNYGCVKWTMWQAVSFQTNHSSIMCFYTQVIFFENEECQRKRRGLVFRSAFCIITNFIPILLFVISLLRVLRCFRIIWRKKMKKKIRL